MKKYKILNESNKSKIYKLAFGAGALVAVVSPVAIVIACSNESGSENVQTANTLSAELQKLKVDEAYSTTDSLSWVNAVQIPWSLANTYSTIEYLIGDYPTVAQARSAAATDWKRTLPDNIPAVGSNVKFWARGVLKPGASPENGASIEPIIDLTTTSNLALVTKASNSNDAVRSVDVAALQTELDKVNYIGTSYVDRISWQDVPELPSSLKNSIARIDYIVGEFADAAAAGSSTTGWSSTLPTAINSASKAQSKVFARWVLKPRVTATTLVKELTSPFASLAKLKNALPRTSGVADLWNFSSHRELQETVEAVNGIQTAYVTERDFFTPAVMWTPSTADRTFVPYYEQYTASMLNIFRLVKPTEDIVNYDDNYKLTSVTASNETRKGKFRFELIKAIVLEDASGERHVFDKDVSPNDKLSDDPRDVNSEHFKDVFTNTTPSKRIVKMELQIREGGKWRQQLTGNVGSDITAKDLYLGILHVISSNAQERTTSSNLPINYSGSVATGPGVELADAIASSVGANAKVRGLETPSRTIAPSFVYREESTVGLDLTPFRDISKMAEAVPDNNTFVFKFKDSPRDSETNRFGFLEHIYRGRFAVIPYEETTKLVTDSVVDGKLMSTIQNLPTKWSDAQLQSFKNSFAYKAGYWHHYFANRTQFYTAGKYYLSEIGVNNNEVVYRINEQYIDPRWTRQTNIAGQRTLVETYRIRLTQNNASQDDRLIAYNNGSSYTATFGEMTAADQANAFLNPEQYGVKYTKGFASLTSIWTENTSLTVFPFVKNETPRLYFNNNYSRLMYGATAQEIDENKDKTNSPVLTGKIIETLASGTGFEFRKLLVASMNAYSFVRGRYNTSLNRMDWTSLFSPEQSLYGSDRTPDTGVNVVDTIFKKRTDGKPDELGEGRLVNKYVFERDPVTKALKPDAFAFTRQSYVDWNTSVGAAFEDSYGPSKREADKIAGRTPFDILRAAFKELLDEYVGEYDPNDPTKTEVVWEMPYAEGGIGNYGYASREAQNVYNAYKVMLRTIDPRLRVVAAVSPTGKNANGEYEDAKVLLDEWPENEQTWQALPSYSDNPSGSPVFPNYHTDNRLGFGRTVQGKGVASPWQGKGAFTINAPTENFLGSNFGYLQTGILIFLSYFSDPANASKVSGIKANGEEILSPVLKIANIVRDKFNEYIAGATLENTLFKSSRANAWLAILKTLKFEDIWKSDMRDLENDDYLGFTVLKPIAQENKVVNAKDANNISADEKLQVEDYSSILTYFSGFIDGLVSLRVWSELRKLTTKDLVDSLLAWQIISPDNLNPLSSTVNDRASLTRSLYKAWYHEPSSTTEYYNVNLSNARVDLDRVDNFYLGEPLYKDANGEWKTVANGGIVY